MNSTAITEALIALLATALVGRVVLSVLPPGRPGFHSLDELGITWAASHLAGVVALGIQRQISQALGIDVNPVTLFAQWAIVLVVRWATSPGAIVPRHAPREEIAGPTARIVALAAFAVAIAAAWTADSKDSVHELASRIFVLADLVALLCIGTEGLRCARRAPLGTATVVLGLSIALALLGVARDSSRELTSVLLCTGASSAFAIAWLRRADRRGRALAILAAFGLVSFGGQAWIFAVGLLVGLALHTPAPSRGRTTAIAAIALCAAVGIALASGQTLSLFRTDDAPSSPIPRDVRIALAALFGVSFAWIAWRLLRAPRAHAEAVSSIDEPRRELTALATAAAVIVVLAAGLRWLTPSSLDAGTVAPLLPICAVIVGLALVRPEEPFHRA